MAFPITYNLNNMCENWTNNSRIILISMFLKWPFYSELAGSQHLLLGTGYLSLQLSQGAPLINID